MKKFVLLLVVVAAVNISDALGNTLEWQVYQRDFNQIEFSKTEERYKNTEDEAIKNKLKQEMMVIEKRGLEIKEISLKDLNRVDRCTTCHLGVFNPDFDEAEQPYRYHPELYLEKHPPEKFGCTVCHQGQGEELTVKAAHDDTRPWEKPLMRGDYLEASCAKCHPDDIKGAFKVPGKHDNYMLSEVPILSAGRKLFNDLRCINCHKVEGYPKEEKIRYDLTQIKMKVKRDWLLRWLKNPGAYLPKAKCPNFGLSDEKARAIEAYLMSLSKVKISALYQESESLETEEEDAYDKGGTLFRESRCVSCHATLGKGGDIGPDLGKVASKVYRSWLYKWIQRPKAYLPETECPRYGFSHDEIILLTAYMMEEYIDVDLPEETEEEVLESYDPALVEEGKGLVRRYACSNCHNIEEERKEIGPELTHIGSKQVKDLDFEKAEATSPRADWLFTKVKNHRIFKDDLEVASYNLSDAEAKSLVVLLLSFTEEDIPENYKIPKKPASTYQPTGDFAKIVEEINCFACHTIKGRGMDVAPDISWQGSRVQEEWLFNFLKNPITIRPILVERMPRFRFSDQEVRIVQEFIKGTLLDDRIPKIVFDGKEGPMEPWIKKGEELYKWYGCHACHQIGMEGGSYGPNLTDVGQRLNEGWVYVWLKNPQAFIPEARMPNFGLPDEEIKALTTYLMSLK